MHSQHYFDGKKVFCLCVYFLKLNEVHSDDVLNQMDLYALVFG